MKIDRFQLIFLSRFFIFLVLLSFFEIGCDVCEPKDPPPPDDNYRDIYYSGLSLGNPTARIFGINKDGTNPKDFGDGELNSSPGRNTLIFLKESSTGSGSKVLQYKNLVFEETVTTLLGTSDAQKELAIVSRDGTKIIFYYGQDALVLADTNLRDGNLENYPVLTEKFWVRSIPAISPDGKSVAFFENQNNNGQIKIKVLDISGSSPVVKYENDYSAKIENWVRAVTISWAEDNKSILYALNGIDGRDMIFIDNMDNSVNQQISVDELGASMPVFSPDGKSIAFAAENGGLYVRKLVSGSENEAVVDPNPDDLILYPAWSPKDNYILYTRYNRMNVREYKGILEVVDLEKSRSANRNASRKVLISDVNKGFWYVKQ